MFSATFWGKKGFNICLRPKVYDWRWKTGARRNSEGKEDTSRQ